jgi:hypothetical protein
MFISKTLKNNNSEELKELAHNISVPPTIKI